MAKQNVQKQREQKKFYDKQCKEVELKVGNMVMLKTQPFIIKAVTPTNVIIQLKDDNTAE